MSEATLAVLGAQVARGPLVVAAVVAAKGSTPREPGAWMIVASDVAHGTIGGGEAERRVLAAARALLRDGGAAATLELPLGPDLDQCCGGHLSVALARFDAPAAAPSVGGIVLADPPRAPVYLYGAGHVGQALAAALAPLPFALTWIDGRDAGLWPVAAAHLRRSALPEADAAAAPPDALHVVMTHSHALDLEIVAAVLARPHRFCGLIGSATKRATFVRRLAERGLDASRLTCPIGVAGIRGKEPAVIAAAVAADLLARR